MEKTITLGDAHLLCCSIKSGWLAAALMLPEKSLGFRLIIDMASAPQALSHTNLSRKADHQEAATKSH